MNFMEFESIYKNLKDILAPAKDMREIKSDSEVRILGVS